MAKLQPYLIAGSDQGLESNVQSFLLPDKAFPVLNNAYVWRNRVKKRPGLKLLGRLRRVLTEQAQSDADGTTDYDIADILSGVRSGQPDAELQPGTVVIRVDPGGGNETVFTDDEDGTFSRTSGTAYNIEDPSFVNYATGEVSLTWTAGGTPPNLTTVEADYNYYPGLPVMGIIQRERSDINFEQSLVFDTVYCYSYDGTAFSEYLSSTSTTWAGSNSQFFWGTNYQGSDSSIRNLFVTNFDNDANSPMRYTNGTTWTDFAPAVGGTDVFNENVGTISTPWTSFPSTTVLNPPVVPGSVTIVLDNGTDPSVILTDPNGDGVLVGVPSTNSGTINYTTGAIALTISPALTVDTYVDTTYQTENNYMFSARILVPYYGRLVALNTYEGATRGGASNFFNRCRASQIGSPVQSNAFISTIPGKGIFIDAPVNQEIISARIFKNTLIVFFERSTWNLRYIGEYGIPFVWEPISSDFGSESQFSTVLFDEGVMAVGNRAIVGANSQMVVRRDNKIPDTVYTFRNNNEGTARVHGIRDFKNELVYWCYNVATEDPDNSTFPNKVLVYNYENDTWASWRSSITAFGYYNTILGITWDRTDILWDDEEVTWDDPGGQIETEVVLCGNQEGFVHLMNFSSVDTESLKINSVDTSGSTPVFDVTNHNLEDGEIILIEGMMFLNTTTGATESTTFNDRTYQVKRIDSDTFSLLEWDTTTQNYSNDYSYTPTVTSPIEYIGGGVITLYPKMEIRTKDLNPFMTEGKQLKLGYIDFLTDVNSTGEVTINLYNNTSYQEEGNLAIGQKQFDTQQNPLDNNPQNTILWNRYFSNLSGQFISVEITYNDDQMNNTSIQASNFVLNAILYWVKAGGRLS